MIVKSFSPRRNWGAGFPLPRGFSLDPSKLLSPGFPAGQSPAADPKRNFLFLQGPNGRFFSLLAKELESCGHVCKRINLCPADWFFWDRPGAVNYRGSLLDWPHFLEGFCRREKITDLILNGEQREYHKVATLCCRSHGIKVVVTDFGYLRSDWITIELEGMSGNSRFPRDPEEIRSLAAAVPHCDFSKKFNHKFWDMARAEIGAEVVNTLGSFLFPHYKTHYPHSPLRSGFFTAKRKIKARYLGKRTKRMIARRIENAGEIPFYLFPMQLESDAQIHAYSHYPDMRTPLGEVISSFARRAPRPSRLLVKVHPLDPGIKDWRKKIKKLAESAGVAERVDYADIGLLDDIIKACAGIVTINSTVGIIGLRFLKQVKTLGQAIYDIPGLTFQGPLDDFWCAEGILDHDFCHAYLKALGGCLHVRGTYYAKEALLAGARSAAARIHHDLVNQPANPEDPRPSGTTALADPKPKSHVSLA